MKALDKTFLAYILLIFISVCQPLAAQNEFDGMVSFDRTIHDFGDILLDDGPQHCTFTMKNISKEVVVINRVISSCGCTDPEWSKQPIRPGESGRIDVTYKNDSGPYPFDKSITVMVTGLSKPVVLRIKGTAHDKKKSLKELFTYACGPLAFREGTPDIGQTEQGLVRHEEFEVANTSSRPVAVEFTRMTPGLDMVLTPNPLPSGAKGKVTCTVDTRRTATKLWGRTLFTATVSEKDRPSNSGTISVKTLIKENFNSLTESQRNAGSLIQFDATSKSFGTVTKGDKKQLSFAYGNMGRDQLIIYKVDSSEPGATIKTTTPLKAGQKGELTVDIDTGAVPEGEVLYILTIITNSPLRPMANVFITGTVEK